MTRQQKAGSGHEVTKYRFWCKSDARDVYEKGICASMRIYTRADLRHVMNENMHRFKSIAISKIRERFRRPVRSKFNCMQGGTCILFMIISLLSLSTAIAVLLIIIRPLGQAIIYKYMVAVLAQYALSI
jgi:hypothetical protein